MGELTNDLLSAVLAATPDRNRAATRFPACKLLLSRVCGTLWLHGCDLALPDRLRCRYSC